MLKAILGSKINQTQDFDGEGNRLTVTNILAGPCVVVGLRTKNKDGFNAVQLGFGLRRITLINKPQRGVFQKAGIEKLAPRFLREIRIDESESTGELKIGDKICVTDVFREGEVIEVTGTSKGKGFAGVVKRHHFKGGPRTHGQSDRERAPGSIGQTTTPGRVYKGKRMAGRMGNQRVTVKNLKVVKIDAEKNTLTVSGLVPGGRNALLVIKKMKRVN